MERFPVLDMILRCGTPGAIAASVLLAVLTGAVAWPPLGWLGIVIALVVGALVFVVAKSYVELVTLITEMLVPR